jgi:hypothetical protein
VETRNGGRPRNDSQALSGATIRAYHAPTSKVRPCLFRAGGITSAELECLRGTGSSWSSTRTGAGSSGRQSLQLSPAFRGNGPREERQEKTKRLVGKLARNDFWCIACGGSNGNSTMPPKVYRSYAAECLRVALKTIDSETRSSMRRMAIAWSDLADQAERNQRNDTVDDVSGSERREA